jgi:V8-like Glu-specific endopeptidase
MAQGAFYVTKTTLEGFEELRIDGRSVLEAYPSLQATLASRGGRELADLFAEPVVTRGNDASPTSISWYAAFDAEPVRLTSLDPGARAAPEARLREQLAELTRLLDDPEIGPLLGGCLHLGGQDDIWVLDGRPLLTNWGVLPSAAARSGRAREEHFRHSLGRYLALAEAPPLSSADWRARHGQSAPPPPAARAAPAAAAALAASGNAGAAPSNPPAGASNVAPGPPSGADRPRRVVTVRRAGRTWVAPLIAVVALALILAYLLIPGVLLYPLEPPIAAAVGPSDDLALRRDINGALEDRAQELREAVDQNVCRADGQLVRPDGSPLDGGGAGASGAGEGTPPGPSPKALLPPDPGALTVPPSAEAATTPAFEGSLVDLLDQATVLVVVAGERGAIGSGFFVAPQTVITNRHVVEGGNPDQIFVTNQALGGLQPARIKDITASSEIGTPDYAVLEVPSAGQLPQLALTSHVERLENVVAGGYPGVIMDTDINFQALRGGDPSAIPQMAVTQGVVTVVQQAARDLPIIVHTANISPGNSGGPLVDSCGRAVGINTFIRVDQESSSRLNYALQASALAAFLGEHGIPHTLLDGACQPQVAAAAPPPREEPIPVPPAPDPGARPAPPAPEPAAPVEPPPPPAPGDGAAPRR